MAENRLVWAVYNYEPGSDDAQLLRINQGDALEVLDNSREDGWIFVQHRITKESGLVPQSYVTPTEPQNDQDVIALFDFAGDPESQDLVFSKGDIIVVTNRNMFPDNLEWWYGHLKAQPEISGKFPAKFVGNLEDEPSLELDPLTPSPSVAISTSDPRYQVLKEIVDTEKSYLDSLRLLAEHYILPLRSVRNGEPILSQAQITSIFMNIEQLIQFNTNLFNDLVEEMKKPEPEIGKIFLGFAPYFKMYSIYVNNHEMATKTVMKLSKKKQAFAEVIERADSRTRQLLYSFLIMPVQRIPRYRLLLTELIKRTPETSIDYPNLEAALKTVSESADHINNTIHLRENRDKILEIQTRFRGRVNIVEAHRRFVREGDLVKMCRKGPRTYRFFLFNDIIAYGSYVSVLGSDSLLYHRSLELSNCSVSLMSDETYLKNAFNIISAKKSFVLQASDAETAQLWVKDIKEQIEDIQSDVTRRVESSKSICAAASAHNLRIAVNVEGRAIWHFNKISSLSPPLNSAFRVDSSRETDENSQILRLSTTTAPVWIPDKYRVGCSICNAKFTAIRRRHHCRQCGAVVCGKCSTNRAVLANIDDEKPVRVCDNCMKDVNNEDEDYSETVHTISTYSLPNDDDLVLEDNDSDQSETVQTRLNTNFNASAVTPTQISVNDSESSLAFCAESKSSEVTSLDSGIPKEALTIRRKPPPCPTHRPPPPPKDVAPVLFPIKLTSLPPMETQDKQDTLPAPVQNQAFTSKNCLSLLPKTTQQNIQEKSEKSEKPQSKIEQVKPLQGQFVLDFKDISAKRVKIIEEDHNEKPKTVPRSARRRSSFNHAAEFIEKPIAKQMIVQGDTDVPAHEFEPNFFKPGKCRFCFKSRDLHLPANTAMQEQKRRGSENKIALLNEERGDQRDGLSHRKVNSSGTLGSNRVMNA